MNLDLSARGVITVEFWLNWASYSNDDRLAMEFTSNFNNNAGGFLVDPNAPQNGGTFAIGIGNDASRNNVFFARPSAGAWHHYAIVLDTTAPAATQITPYVDGQPVTYTKGSSGTGQGNFANSTLYLMSRGGTSLLGNGTLDELAIYSKALSATTITEHYNSYGTNRRPKAAFTASPSPARTGQTVTFNASSSVDGSSPITSLTLQFGDGQQVTWSDKNTPQTHSYVAVGNYTATLTVIDDQGCSTAYLSAGQTAFCNGSGVATTTRQIDATPPVLKLTVRRHQKLGKSITIKARCDTRCGARATGKIRIFGARQFRLVQKSKEINPGQTRQLKLRLTKKARRAAKDAKKGQAKIEVTATDDSSNKTTVKRRVRLR
jgi:PKD repeat protein